MTVQLSNAKRVPNVILYVVCRSNNHRGQPPSGSPPGLFEW